MTVEKLNEIYAKHEESFVSGFHNVLWQLMINEAHAENVVCFLPKFSSANGKTTQIVLASADGGYHDLPLYMDFNANIDDVLEDLNEQVFGLDRSATGIIELQSFRSVA